MLSAIGFICMALFAWNSPPAETGRYHDGVDPWLPFGYNELFAGSGQCLQCHGSDPEDIASVTLKGEDVNVVDSWRSTMMANSAKDPFWRAKVSHEIAVNPDLSAEIEDKCTACHAPLGHFNAHHIGQDNYSIAEMTNDSLGLDGVSCLACHQQSPVGLGDEFSGSLNFDTTAVAYGQYESPLASPMVQFAQYTPVHGPHIEDAGICAGCHTLITSTVDLDGEFTGDDFVEQATYHEWLNSVYAAEEGGVTCQGCHMPSLGSQNIFLIAGFETAPRNPYYLHEFAGANTLMLKLMKDNAQELGIAATDEQFDATINQTTSLLQSQSLELDLELWERDADTAHFDVRLLNLAGHKFPSGYPSRRLVVEFVVTDDQNDVIFSSGSLEADYSLAAEGLPFEPHYDVIREETEVQIYEMVMGDIEGNFTTILDRAYIPLKDNRLVPSGFTTVNNVYDTTLLAGSVLNDLDFNKEFGSEGSGTDELRYSVPMEGYFGTLTANVTVHYQSLPPRWMEEIFEVETDEINAFQDMFDAADQSPVVVEQAETFVDVFVGVAERADFEVKVLPTLSTGEIRFHSKQKLEVRIYSQTGILVDQFRIPAGLTLKQLRLAAGSYLVSFSGGVEAKRIVITNEQISTQGKQPKFKPMKKLNPTMLVAVLCLFGLGASAQVTFTTSYELNAISGSSYEDCVVDMNGDYLDDVVRITSTSTMYIDFQLPGGGFEQTTYDINIVTLPSWSICAGDLNGDGLNDLLLGGGSAVGWLMSEEGGDSYSGQEETDYIFCQRSTMMDIDLDGHLDGFVCHDVDQSHPYRNDGTGQMVEDQSLIETVNMAGNYAAIWVDYDNDGDTDLFMTKCRQGSTPGDPERTNRMYRNDGDGTFSEVGSEVNLDDNSQSWSTVFEDFDNDGDFDAFIVNHDFANRFMLNDGTGMFTDIIGSTGIDANDLGAWESDGADFDNNGFVDIMAELDQGMYFNNGDLTFNAVSSGFDDGAIGDLNNDGFMDVLKSNVIYMNDGNGNNWVKVGLEGFESNFNGIGARIEILGDWGIQVREVRSGESFSPMSTLIQQFGIGEATSITSIVVHWPSGIVTTLDNPEINSSYVIPEAGCISTPNEIAVGGETSICEGGEVVLTAEAGGAQYLWSNGADTETITVTAAGNYSVLIYDAEECVSVSNNVLVTMIQDETPTISIEGDAVFCEGGEAILSSTLGANYNWSNGMTGSSIVVNEDGEYTVMIDAICSDDQIESQAVTVTVLDAAADPTGEDVIVSGPQTVTLVAAGENLVWYENEVDVDPIGNGTDLEVDIQSTETYWVEANTIYGGIEDQGGKEFEATGGGLPSTGGVLYFDAWESFTIVDVTMYIPDDTADDLSGDRTIQLFDSNGQVVAEHTEFYEEGVHVVELDFAVEAGMNASIGCVQNNQFRNNAGVEYPYSIGTFGEITGSTYGGSYYYYFYDWNVKSEEWVCPSNRVPVVAGIVSVEEISSVESFDVYPNPVSDQLTVSMITNEAIKVQITMTDAAGRTVYSEALGTIAGQRLHVIDVQKITTGLYNLEVTFGDEVAYSRIVVE